MKVAVNAAFAILLSSSALAQEDDRAKRIVERIEKEIRDSHERTRDEIRTIIRAEIQRSNRAVPPVPPPTPQPPPKPVPPRVPDPPKLPAPPQPRKVYLGITAGDLTDAERKALGTGGGIKIAAVRGPAKDADLRAGDVLIELDGEAATEERIGGILARHKPGDTIDATVLRANKRTTVKVVLAERKD